MTVSGDTREPRESIEVGGEVRRIAILTVRKHPCACYLARRLRTSGAEIFLLSQTGLKVEPGSLAYFRRLFRRRGLVVCADRVLLHLVRSTMGAAKRIGRAAVGVGRSDASRVSDPSKALPVQRDDSAISDEDWLTVIEIEDVNRGRDQDLLRSLRPDLVLLAGAPILSRKTIEIARVACLNPHYGITPAYAGSSPICWAVYERRFQDVGYTVHLVVPKVDSGPVLHQEKVAWDPFRPVGTLGPILAQKMYDKLADVALAIARGERFQAVPQGNPRVMPPAGLIVRGIAELRRMAYARGKGRPHGQATL